MYLEAYPCHLVAWVLGICLLFLVIPQGLGQPDILVRANRLESEGRFAEASLALTVALGKQGLPNEERRQLEFGLDRLRRIRLDFPYTESALFAELRKSVRDLSREEFAKWIDEGRFDSREIDGQRFFMVASVSNLFFRYPELNARRLPPKNTSELEARHLDACVAIKKEAQVQKRPYVLPKRFRVSMRVTVDADAVPDSQTIRAWLPIPRSYPFQGDFSLISASSASQKIDEENSRSRSIYLEQPAHRKKPTEFSVQYEYMTRGVWFDIAPENVRPSEIPETVLKEFTCETEHVMFTPAIRELSNQIAGGETNPYLKAKKFYDWIADNIKYSFAIEYSTIPNISEYCRSHGYGDCGQEALLFISLCRLNGIPARWQSGWNIFPGSKSNHDWTEIYLAPYGWVPVDPYMGIYATRYATTLSPEKRSELRDFYFGGLDQYRMIANSDHNQPLSPAKQSMRSDNVDFQRGEVEWGNHNIYFDQFNYELTAKEVPSPAGKIE